jgi:hypothetical protein
MKKRSLLPRRLICISLLSISSASVAFAAPCDDIARDVSSAVAKEPGKVLMIVEDALVINETCACEIVRAAILASKADASQVNQIVQTAISVAPKMSGVIMDCATAVSPAAGITSQATVAAPSGKSVKNPLPAVEPQAVEEEFNPIPSSIRGVYLIQPPAGGFLPRPRDKDGISPTTAVPFFP